MDTGDDFTGPINIGNIYQFTIQELAEKIVMLTNSSSQIVYKSLPKDDLKQRKSDIIYAKRKISCRLEINLIEGLKQTIKFLDIKKKLIMN